MNAIPTTMHSSVSTSSEESLRIFNSALVSSQSSEATDLNIQISQLLRTPAIQAMMRAIRDLSMTQGITERAAAEEVISSFRKLDTLWREALVREGLQRLTSSK